VEQAETMTATFAQTEAIASSQTNAPTADVADFIAGSLEMDWSDSATVVSEPQVKSFIHVIGLASLLSACIWGAAFGLVQII